MFERPDSGDRALLVHIVLPEQNSTVSGDASVSRAPSNDIEADRSEFRELARSAGLEILGMVTGKRQRAVARHFIGKGKIEEIRLLLLEHEADVVLFGQQLSPSQERNLERELKVRVLDRNSLILDIFAQRARTFEGKLQVELAQLTHLSTRLVRGWTHLERQKGGIGLRGPGETQLETDRRLLNDRVRMLKKRLAKVRSQREQGRSQRSRSGVPTVALVGYTNAGKSTLFNRLCGEKVYAADQLFATLDPTLRRVDLPGGNLVVLADTVGFIRDLPHELVDSFRSTLTETLEADLLLHVIDDSDEERDVRQANVDAVLAGIGAKDVAQLLVFNKTDLTGHTPRVEVDESGVPYAAWVSAMEGEGLDALKGAISDRLSGARSVGWLTLLPEQGKLRAQLHDAHAIVEEHYLDDGGLSLKIDMDAVEHARLAHEHRTSLELVPDAPSLAVARRG